MANNQYSFGKDFITYIKQMIPGAHEASGGREIRCRCKYCSDGQDLSSEGHMYIRVPQSDDDAPLFHCFKCNTNGVINSKTLLEWGLYDPVIGQEIDNISKRASKSAKFKGSIREWYPFTNHVYDLNLAQEKLAYINNRIGTQLTIDDCMQQKIVLNLKEAVDFNRIPEYTRHPNIMNELNHYFVGFLSLDNNFVNLRRMCDEGIVYKGIDKRYINYNIHNKLDNTEKMYVMPTNIDLSRPEKVQIHIAEGPFDILSIRYNLRLNESGIFGAVTGSGYRNFLAHLITTFKIFYFDVHVYPDNDDIGSDRTMRQIKEYVAPFGAQLYIHRNVGEKDFGVSPDRIHEKVYWL